MSKKRDAGMAFEEFSRFINEFKNESDRACVILVAAKLDLLLYHLLSRFLLPATGKNDELLDGDNPLGTFSAKIALAHRLGLIDDQFFRALNLIRKIRNSFAHESGGITLSSGSHRDRVRELVLPLKDSDAYQMMLNHYFEADEGKPSSQFRCAVALVTLRLDGAVDHCDAEVNWEPWHLITAAPPESPDDLGEPD